MLERREGALRGALKMASQTNEAGRSAALLVGLTEAVRRCGLHPVDAASEEGALRLRSFVWPWQIERFARLDAAVQVARRHPVVVDRASAGEWVEQRLAEVAPDVLTVAWQSITRQYWPATTRRICPRSG